MKKLIATISIITALGIGAFALNSVLPAGAAGSITAQATDPSARCGGPRTGFKDVLDKLVADGTITQAQEDAIIQAMKDAREGAEGNRPAPGSRLRVLQGMLDVSASTIGVPVDELKAALQAGQSVADVANAHTVAPADVEKAIVDAGTTKIDEALAAGKLTEEQATMMKTKLPELANKFVNHTREGC